MYKAAILQPDLVLGNTIVNLNPEILARYQIKGLVLDVDETLVPLKYREVSPELKLWVEEIRAIAEIWLVSNNISDNRIGGIARSLDLPYIIGAGKPSRRKLKQAADAMNFPLKHIAMVGDRLFTDVLGGNRLGMFTILVEPMVDPAIVAQSYPIRTFEVLLSKALGVSLIATSDNFTKVNKMQD
jgi:uncharacterized protein